MPTLIAEETKRADLARLRGARPSLRVRRAHAPPARRPRSRGTRRVRQASWRRVAAAALGFCSARLTTCARPSPVRRCRDRGRMIVMTVTDALGRPLRDLRISVTDRCNFRCVYCMPREVFGRDYEFLERAELLTFEEIERLARIFVGDHGVTKIRLTRGAPLGGRGGSRWCAARWSGLSRCSRGSPDSGTWR